jgi:hypothetical protein
LILGIPVATLLFGLSQFNRMWVDDFCYENSVGNSNFINAQLSWWFGSSGRFSSTLVITFISSHSNTANLGVYTFLLFAFLYLSFFYYFRKVEKYSFIDSIGLGMFIAAVLFILTPNKVESWFWLSGSATYLIPLILLTNSWIIFLTHKKRIIEKILFSVLIFFATGANETIGVLVLVSLLIVTCLLLIIPKLWNNNIIEKKTLLISGTLSSVVAFMIMYSAPGNMIRQSHLFHPSLLESLIRSPFAGLDYLIAFISQNLLIIIISLVLLTLLRYYYIKDKNISACGKDRSNEFFVPFLSIVSVLIVGVTIYSFIGIATQNALQPDRSHITIVYMIILALISISYYLAKIQILYLIKPFYINIVATIITLIIIINFPVWLPNLEPQVSNSISYSLAYDQFIKGLQEKAGLTNNQNVTVKQLPQSGYFYSAPAAWGNICIVNFFKLPPSTNLHWVP